MQKGCTIFVKENSNVYGESVQGEKWFDPCKNRFTSSLVLFTYNTKSLTFQRAEHLIFLFSYRAPKSPVNCFSFKVHVLKDKK